MYNTYMYSSKNQSGIFKVPVTKIISGGQTGADRAGLDFAIKHSIPHGGWIPKGRRTEAGFLPDRYHLQETTTTDYPTRTEKNILDSDGTAIFSHGSLKGGSALTRELAIRHKKHWIHIDLAGTSLNIPARLFEAWIRMYGIRILNIAGPRGSKDPKIYQATVDILEHVISSQPHSSLIMEQSDTFH